MGIRDWLAIIVIIFIVLILLDGFRRKWLERKNRIVMKLDKSISGGGDDDDILVKSELPNGGARTKKRAGDADVPVLMESVELDEEEFEEYPEPAGFDEDVPDEDREAGGVSAGVATDHDWLDDYPDEDDEPPQDPGDKGEPVTAGGEDPWNDSPAPDEEPTPEKTAAAAGEPARPAKRGFLGGRRKDEDRIEPTFGDQEFTFSRDDQGELDLEHNALFDHAQDDEDDDDDHQDVAEQVLIINVMARPGTVIEGSRLLPVLLKQGMRLGDMSIFHRHADASGKGPVMFSMANMVKPGTFSMSEMETFTTPGISFFMQLPNKIGNMQCFEQMLKTAEAVRSELDALLKDENRSVFTRQTIEHSRQRIRDFELEMLARK